MKLTYKDFISIAKSLEKLLGVPLTTNVWHKHYSIYTMGENGSNQHQLVCSDTARGAIEQIRAVVNVLELKRKELC